MVIILEAGWNGILLYEDAIYKTLGQEDILKDHYVGLKERDALSELMISANRILRSYGNYEFGL